MGNRATVSFAGLNAAGPCVYLHWNGGLCSVEAFLDIVRPERDANGPAVHLTPIAARDAFARVALAYMKSSVYVGRFDECDTDNHDNGTYIVDSGLTIIGRAFVPEGYTEERNERKRAEIVADALDKISLLGEVAYRALTPPDVCD